MRRLLLLMLVPVALLAQTTASGSVEGRVTNTQTGEGIAGATLRLSPVGARADGTAGVVYTATSQPDGSFHFDGVEAGAYLLFGVQRGFSLSDSAPPVQVISVAEGQQVTGVAVQLIPQGSISGRLLDDEGNPVSGRVEAFVAYISRGKTKLRRTSSAGTGDGGDYVLKNITAGKYFVVAEPDDEPSASNTEQSRFELVRTFYPKALDFESATAIDTTAGQNVAGIDIHLQRAATYHVRGKIEGVPNTARRPLTLSIAPAAGQAALARTQQPKNDGTFDIESVLPGSYVLQLTGLDTGPMAERVLARQEIGVGNKDADGVVLSAIPPITISGRVTLEDVNHANLSQVRIMVLATEDTQMGSRRPATVDADGTFRIQDLNPEPYTVLVESGPTGTYVKSILFNRQDITNGVMDVSGGGAGELEVVLRVGAAEVDGTVQSDDSSSAAQSPRLTVALVPDTLAPDGSGMLFGSAFPGGAFAIRNVPPGHYHAFAIAKWNNIWQNGDFVREMESRGTAVEVQENARLQIQLQAISADEIQRTAARLGLTLQ